MLWMQDRLLDAARDALGKGATDYRLCQTLGISTAYMTQLRKGRAIVSQGLAFRLAVIAKAPAMEVLPAIEMQRALRDQADVKMVGTWQAIAKRLSGSAATVALALGLGTLAAAPTPSQAASVDARALYIMTNRRRTGPGLAPA